jgi:hypothetical protein
VVAAADLWRWSGSLTMPDAWATHRPDLASSRPGWWCGHCRELAIGLGLPRSEIYRDAGAPQAICDRLQSKEAASAPGGASQSEEPNTFVASPDALTSHGEESWSMTEERLTQLIHLAIRAELMRWWWRLAAIFAIPFVIGLVRYGALEQQVAQAAPRVRVDSLAVVLEARLGRIEERLARVLSAVEGAR